jgi:hypothetical protein
MRGGVNITVVSIGMIFTFILGLLIGAMLVIILYQ